MLIIINKDNGQIIAKAQLAATFWRRLKGLLGAPELPAGHGLLITPCCSVHTFGMRYPIDVIFVDKDNRIAKTVEGMGAGRVAVCFKAKYAVELPSGTLSRLEACTGTQLEISNPASLRS